MGTRNLTIVKIKNKTRVAQYGQWDGYPTGQGAEIARFLKNVDLEKFKKQVAKVKKATKKDIEAVNALENWKKEYPYLSRDAGAEILQMIHDGGVKFVVLDEDFKNDGLFCEYWYEIDLDKETVTMNGKGYTFQEWQQEGFMELLEKREEDQE